jgi:hypothetical protein
MDKQKKFDVVIAGGGIAGLTLAYFLKTQPSTKKVSLLIIDHGSEIESANISFWAKSVPITGMPLVGSWKEFEVVFKAFKRTLILEKYAFYATNRTELLRFLKNALKKKNVIFQADTVLSLTPLKKGVAIRTTSGKKIEAAWVFDSTLLSTGKVKTVPVHGWMWEIETSKPTMNPATMTLFDFNATKLPNSFLYLLPLSATKTIVEFSSFSHTPSIGECEYWLTNRLNGVSYKMTRLNQKGSSSYQANSPHKNTRIIPIGLKAGAMNSCSGFAFMNIVRHAKHLAKHFPNHTSLRNQKKTWYQSPLDYLFTLLFTQMPSVGVRLLALLFKNSQGDVVLAYLDGALSPKQIMRMPFGEKS